MMLQKRPRSISILRTSSSLSDALDADMLREVILTMGHSKTVEMFLKQAHKDRKFTVIVAESAPSYVSAMGRTDNQVPRAYTSRQPDLGRNYHNLDPRLISTRGHVPLYKSHHRCPFSTSQRWCLLAMRIISGCSRRSSLCQACGGTFWSIQIRTGLELVS